MTADHTDEAVRKRKEVLELAQKLGNVSKACRQANITRTQFYAYRKRLEEQGLRGLENRPPVHKTHPMATLPAVVAQVVLLSVAHPSWGCVRLSQELARMGISLSSPTVQKVLSRHGMGTARDRWLRLEEEAINHDASLTAEQLAWIDHWNPAFRERGRESSRPGELLVQHVQAATSRERIHVHVALDTFGGVAFGLLRPARQAEDAVELLAEHVLPFFSRRKVRIRSLITPDTPVLWGSSRHPFERFLARAGIEHHSVHREPRGKNGFLERFWRDFQTEFVAPRRKEWVSAPVARWQEEFAAWLSEYNTVRPYLGFRNMGLPPCEFVRRATVSREG